MLSELHLTVNIYMDTKRAKIISLTKTCTWRVVASLDTFLLSWLITGNAKMGMGIASLEVITKMFLYYAHERQWEKPKFNRFVIRTHSRLEDMLGM